MMKRPLSARMSSAGVTHAKLAIEDGLGWLFREQPTEDYGIDAQVEVVDGEDVRGRLVALQIKGGNSWFRESGPGGWWFRPDVAHVRYWTDHSLPVAIVMYRPQTQRCHWQLINSDTLVRTSTGGWKVLVPEAQVLDDESRGPLQQAAEGDAYVLRIRELRLARPWMEMLAKGKRLVVDMEEWVNKLSGRGAIAISVDNEDGQPPTELAGWSVLLGTNDYADVVPKMIAWADVSIHEETYDDAEYEQYETECVHIDSEGDRIVTEGFDEWRAPRVDQGLRPYANHSGEVDYWRLELSLNELGQAFLLVDRFAVNGTIQLATS